MKKYLLMLFAVLLFVPFVVSADAEIKTLNGRTYVIEELNVTCEQANDLFLVSYYKGSLYGYVYDGDYVYYKYVGNNTCELASQEDVFNILKYFSDTFYYFIINNNKLFKQFDFQSEAVRTTDTVLDPNKYYVDSSKDIITDPVVEEISNYYELEFFSIPDQFLLDPDKTYYDEFYQLENNPQQSNISDYYIKKSFEQVVSRIDIDFSPDLLHNIYDDIMEIYEDYYDVDFYYYSVEYFEEQYFLVYYLSVKQTESSDRESVTLHYDFSGNRINTFNEFDWIYFLPGHHSYLVHGRTGNQTYFEGLLDDHLDVIFELEDEIDNEPIAFENGIFLIYGTGDYIVKIYELLEGAGQTFNGNDMSFKFSGHVENLTAVKVNNVALGDDDYSEEPGSTIITLNESYLDTLSSGTYTLSVEYSDGGSTGVTFSVNGNPNTGDGIVISIILGIISLFALVGISFYLKNKKVM